MLSYVQIARCARTSIDVVVLLENKGQLEVCYKL